MKRFALAAAFFVFICLCGTFIALAGGAQWGTADAGVAATFTLICAVFGAGLLLMEPA